jgi:hypothetical protein
MSIFRTFSSAASRPFFTPPIEGVNGSNYWEKIEQLSSPAQGLWSLWMNNETTEVYASGAEASPFYNRTRIFSKATGQWQLVSPNLETLTLAEQVAVGNKTSKDGRRSFGHRTVGLPSALQFYIVENNNGVWTSYGIDESSLYGSPIDYAISSDGNAVFYSVRRTTTRFTKLFKFENLSWTLKLFITPIDLYFPNYIVPICYLNGDGSRFGIGGNSESGATTHIYRQVGSNSFPRLGDPITFQTNGVLKSLLLNDEGNRVAAIIGEGPNQDNYYVEVWEFNGTAWNILGTPINTGGLDGVSSTYASLQIDGRWFSFDGNRFVGRQMAGPSNNTRAVQAYKWNGSSWVTMGQQIKGNAANYNFGARVWFNNNATKFIVSGGKDPTEQSAEIWRYIS